jgi:esterase/lipase superfamily enzyme
MLEMHLASVEEADVHLTQAAPLLETEAGKERDPQRKVILLDGLSQVLITRAGIAAKLLHFDRPVALIDRARGQTKRKGEDSLAFDLLATSVRQQIVEQKRDLQGAFDLALAQIDIIARMRGAESAGLMADATEEAGYLLLRLEKFEEARRYLELALDYKSKAGEATWRIKLRLADIAEHDGKAAEAERLRHEARQSAKSAISEIRVMFGTNRAPKDALAGRFGTEPGFSVALGEAIVLVPGGPSSKDAEFKRAPTSVGLLPSTDYERLIALQPVVLSPQAFAEAVARRSSKSELTHKEALVFVHGFATPFEFALMRTGQLIRDLSFDGPAFAFSWPSQGRKDLASYRTDEKNANASVPMLLSFLKTAADASGAEKIHIVAHSMGNQLLLAALVELTEHGPEDLRSKIGELVFASPDVDQGVFQTRTARLSRSGMTLYATSRDQALNISWLTNLFSQRAGSVGWGLLSSGTPVIATGVDSINVTAAGPDLLDFNHDIYARNPVVAEDLRRIVQSGTHPPDARNAQIFQRCSSTKGVYWMYVTRTETGTRSCS